MKLISATFAEPDLFNCTSGPFIELRRQLAALEAEELTLNTYVAVRLARELREASQRADNSSLLYGADLLVIAGLLSSFLSYEAGLAGLNLTHSQDKDYASNIVSSAGIILRAERDSLWRRARSLNATGPEDLLRGLSQYLATLTISQHDTFTSPFELVDANVILGLDVGKNRAMILNEISE